MSDLITRRLLAVAGVWALLVLLGSFSSTTVAGALGSVVGALVGSIFLMVCLKLVYRTASRAWASVAA